MLQRKKSMCIRPISKIGGPQACDPRRSGIKHSFRVRNHCRDEAYAPEALRPSVIRK